MQMSKTTKALRITVVITWLAALAGSLINSEPLYHGSAVLTAFAAAALIRSARDTQGHYVNIAQAYMLGSIVWGIEEILRFTAALLGGASELYLAIAHNISYIPLVFLSGGLILMVQSEYNKLHFEKMTLHTFAVAFFMFMVMQKLVLVHHAGMKTSGFRMFCAMLYFFVAVFTIVFIIAILIQTRFRGHTFGTNLSAAALTLFCMLELDRLYSVLSTGSERWMDLFALELLGLVIYSWAQSDPRLDEREIEPDEISPDEKVKSIYVWGNSAGFLVLGSILYAVHFFDTRDMYLLVIAALAYATIFKSIQANVYNTQRLEQQKRENQRLEEMVEEKTKELREANEELRTISETDALTGLYNRRYGRELVQSLADAEDRRPFAVMLMDLNHFKQVNDNFGHETGDIVLMEVGRKLGSLADKGCTAVRLGGDEFIVVIPERDGEPVRETAKGIAEEICNMMDQPVETDDGEMFVPACIGIGLFPDDAEDADLLYQRTDEAMYDIKHKSPSSAYKFID
ncbi:MAG: diguanylate cyclase [Clostridiales bacterium]|nr:diguanylate cyclase [Clostridiales bacterium]